MDSSHTSAAHSATHSTPASRRNEDIALDLMKFIASQTEMGRGGTVGFTAGGGKGQSSEHVDQLLSLYARCLKAVEGK